LDTPIDTGKNKVFIGLLYAP